MRDTAGSAAAPAARCRKFRRGSFTASLPEIQATKRLIPPCRLDDRPPFLDLGLLISTQRLRRLPLARRDFEPLVGEGLMYGWIAQRVQGRRVELADDILRRAPGRK